MSYDLFTFRLPPGADPSDYATEVVESFDDDVEPGPSDPSVAELVSAFRGVFPEVEVAEQDDETAMLLLEDRLVSVDLWPSHTEVCVSYSVAKDEAWITGLLVGIARAAAVAGHDTLFDAQFDRPVVPTLPADAAAIGEKYAEGLRIVDQLRAEHEGAAGGFFKRLWRRR